MSVARAGALCLCLAACAATPPRAATEPGATPLTLEDFVRVRCATDGSDVFITWEGQVWAFVAGEPPRHLFHIVGVNVARCGHDAGNGWFLTSRELMYYLDPATGQVLDHWTNPWTGRTVRVAHVSNSPVQARLDRAPDVVRAGGLASYVLDVPLFYPNALAGDPALAAYSPQPSYQAGEFFRLTAPVEQIADASRPAVKDLVVTWQRLGPWLPWMAMGARPGWLVYSATGTKVQGVAELPGWLAQEIRTRLPRFASAPRCFLAAPNETSWSYFARHREAFERDERFPLPAPVEAEVCAAAP